MIKVVCLSLQAGVQPTLDLSAATFISVQCASPGRGGEMVGVCSVCARQGGGRNCLREQLDRGHKAPKTVPA